MRQTVIGRVRTPAVPRLVYVALTAVILGVTLAIVAANTGLMAAHGGEDFAVYRFHAENWLNGQGYYPAFHLAGPYPHHNWNSAYPPPFALFMVPWLGLPGFLWWVVPAVVVGYTLIRWQPAPWTWPLLALCLMAPRTIGLILWGNSTMWVVAAVSATLFWRIPFTPLIFLKPVLVPFALIGARDRRWWAIAGAGSVVALLMLPMWFDYATSVRNGEGIDWTHSLFDIAFVLIPLIAWFGRKR